MKTDDLINMLARDAAPAERKRIGQRMLIGLAVGLVIAVLLVAFGLGLRPDIGAARMPVMMKALFAAMAAAVMLPLAMRLMRPGRPLGWRLAAIGVFAALSLAAGAIAMMGEAPGERMRALTAGVFPWCVVLIPVLAAPTAAAMLWLLRGFAPTRLGLAGAAIGALAGGVGAVAYAMYCPTDSIAFVTTWYVLGIALSAALGALIVSRFLRW
jgi:hypothetical protein